MHGDYIEDVVADIDGFQHFCSFCVDKFTVWTVDYLLQYLYAS